MKMCQAFQENNLSVELLCYSQDRECKQEEIFEKYGISKKFCITALYIQNLRAKFFQHFFTILKKIKEYDNNALIYGRDVYGIYLATLLGKNVIYESHGLPATKLYGFIEKRLLKSSKLQKVIVISNKLKEMYLGQYDIEYNDKFIVLHDGADEVDLLQPKIDLGKGFHIGYIGSLYYRGRGIDIIIKLAQLHPELNFHLIGGKKAEVDFWQGKASSNIQFYGFLPHSETTKYLLSFDIVLMPYQANLSLDNGVNSSSWMSPMKMFEYMAARKPIISSNLRVITEVLNSKNSILVSPDKVDEWSYEINQLYNNQDMALKLSDNAYNDLMTHYTWKNRVINILKLYE
jgi:glycosyltransferase involved in cell wall biosynthesis